jgi:hypothetical protein
MRYALGFDWGVRTLVTATIVDLEEHLATNVMLLLATASGCSLIAEESLKLLKSTGRRRDAKGKWRNWRNMAVDQGSSF